MDRKIDFLIIGAQKSGTTTLYNWLMQHPDIYLPREKENPFFAKNDLFRQGIKYLRPFYRDCRNEKFVGMAFVHLMYFRWCTDRIYNYNPEAKIIAVLRNPVDRAYSAYWYARRNLWEDCESFEQAIKREKFRKKGSYHEQTDFTYLLHGHYSEQLQRYFDFFGKDKVMILLLDDLKTARKCALASVLDFLGLPSPDVRKIDFCQDSNRAAMPRIRWLQKFLLSREAWYKRLGRKCASNTVREWIRSQVTNKIIKMNAIKFQYPPMNPDTRKRLVEYFRPHNAHLEQMIDRDLGHWNC